MPVMSIFKGKRFHFDSSGSSRQDYEEAGAVGDWRLFDIAEAYGDQEVFQSSTKSGEMTATLALYRVSKIPQFRQIRSFNLASGSCASM